MSSAIYSFINSITNSISTRYEIKSQISTAGLWKIYLGIRKTTGKHVAIFIFEKRSLDGGFKRERGYSRNDTEKVYELLKKEASNLARLRHPSILEVVEPVSESRSSIAFVTEPLMGTLSHLISANAGFGSDKNDVYEIDELEIQKGLLQVGKGLQFMNDARVVHHNLTPESIFVNAKGDWKIGGLGFGVFLNNPNDGGDAYFEYNEYLPDECQINLDYAAPEFILDNQVLQANDMFSLGCLAYAVHNKGISLLHTFNNLHTYERKIQALSTSDFTNMPTHLQPVIRRLLTREPSHRLTAAEFQNSKYFDNILVSTMKFLETFPEKTREEKSQFMKGLARVLNQFPERVLKRKILPSLLEELKNHQLLPYTIPNIFIITQQLSQDEFCQLVLPPLKPIFNVRDPPQNMIVLLEKLDVFQQKTPREVFRDDIMPLVYAALEAPTPVVQEKALRIIPSLSESLDYTTVKNSLFPRVQVLFAQTTLLSVKVSTLICFHSMIKVIDKYTMQEKLVPLLKNIKTKEPAVMLATLAVYDEMGKHLDKEIVATEILPQLWRMSFGPLLNLDQFKKFMKTIRELTTRVEEAHTRHLTEVKSLEEQTRSVSAKNSPANGSPQVLGGEDAMSFEALVQGGRASAPTAATTSDIFAVGNGSNASLANAAKISADDLTCGWSSSGATPGRSSPMMATLSPTSATSSPVRGPATLSNYSSTVTATTSTATPTYSSFPAPPQPQQQQQQQQQQRSSFTSQTQWTSSSLKPQIVSSSSSNIPAISTPPAFQSTPALPPPLTAGMSNLSIQPTNTTATTPNYAALRSIPQPTSSPAMATPHRPSSMELLQPVSLNPSKPAQSSQQSQSQIGHRNTNLNVFDPLG
ncbi:hypothetical protein VTP01DRAFT_5982 [Rhizomucor pusillus]|uniref:uncharacterized protein n=1 Tax=Rhizomucor pusillus TaxID=4840 RepID=UPI003742FBB3